jgi:hypothetical protein
LLGLKLILGISSAASELPPIPHSRITPQSMELFWLTFPVVESEKLI